MKTSLIINDYVFKEAQKESLESNSTLSEVISRWASEGLKLFKQRSKVGVKKFKPVTVGKVLIDINSRDWMDQLSGERF